MHNNDSKTLRRFIERLSYVNRNSLCALRISLNSYQIEEEYFECMWSALKWNGWCYVEYIQIKYQAQWYKDIL